MSKEFLVGLVAVSAVGVCLLLLLMLLINIFGWVVMFWLTMVGLFASTFVSDITNLGRRLIAKYGTP